MSIKFGDMGKEIAYDVTRGPISGTSGIEFNRTLDNRRGRFIRFKMKANIVLDFDFIEEATLTTLRKDISNGTIGTYTFIDHPEDENLLDFVGVNNPSSTNVAIQGEDSDENTAPLTITPAPSPTGTEFTSGGYDTIEAVDGSFFSVTPSAGNKQIFDYQFDLSTWKITNKKDLIRRLTLLHRGNGSFDFKIKIRNFGTGTWVDLAQASEEGLPSLAGNDDKLYGSLAPDRAFTFFDPDFINGSDIVIFRVVGVNDAEAVRSAFVALAINGFEVAVMDPTDVFNFRESFVGAGLRGTLNLEEI